ncbi:MAG: CoA pyrophosphatase [Bradymonadales bacterium]|nr:CoA pyrophosphatase [Bradymonadales bacterium]
MGHRDKSTDTAGVSPAILWQRIEAMAHRPASSLVPPDLAPLLRPAAVLIPFYLEEDRPYLLFTKRSQNLPTHRGEISFPGGGRREGDPDLLATALRETREELGIDPATVRVIGLFDEVPSIAGYRVTPYVAHIPPPPVPAIDPSEVEEVIEVEVVRLLDERIHRVERWKRFGQEFPIHFFSYDRHLIWGLTGGLVHRLVGWLKGQQPEVPGTTGG